MKGHALFIGEMITKWWKFIDEIQKSSCPELLGHFQPNLAQRILGLRGLKFVQMKSPTLFQGEILMKKQKWIDEIQKSSPEPLSQVEQKGDKRVLSSPNQCYDIIIGLLKCVYWFKLVSRVSNVANGPLINFFIKTFSFQRHYCIGWGFHWFFSSRRVLKLQYLANFCIYFVSILNAIVTSFKFLLRIAERVRNYFLVTSYNPLNDFSNSNAYHW